MFMDTHSRGAAAGAATDTVISFAQNDSLPMRSGGLRCGQSELGDAYAADGFTFRSQTGGRTYVIGEQVYSQYADAERDALLGVDVAMTSERGAPFSLRSAAMRIWSHGPAGLLTVVGHKVRGGQVVETVQVARNYALTPVTFDASWSNLRSVDFRAEVNGSGGHYVALEEV
ncbi:MAG: hypothetical protein AAFQ51_18795, partial [Pseudomonadota bacterium]